MIELVITCHQCKGDFRGHPRRPTELMNRAKRKGWEIGGLPEGHQPQPENYSVCICPCCCEENRVVAEIQNENERIRQSSMTAEQFIREVPS